ncbi:L-threonylcarbamoyladenylate synthase [Faecalicoccus pleomorphus]|uniref:L-threonylcarbamoyladenylate synthase n=1 Tax=Faecalicoccus pleomorphus TaxID=1323 RepID=UPI0025A4841D|nr:L-threonylcarbamoyladenylate synthase [Faecalicoccus pleomorphus]MDM8292155.1 L-threonylcarbamoyladenylate synthase [Faecalicoccus pleomorphus]
MRTYSKEEINAVADALQNHKIIALPTDTVYGVGVMYGDLKDLQRLKNAKHRPETKPIPMMVSSIEHMEQVAVVDERVKKIAEHFLPGALTLVLRVKEEVPAEYTNGLETIAVRIPDEPFILKVIDVLNTPLLVTSANQSGAKTALTSDDVFEQLPDIDGIVLGTCRALQASTIVDCTQEKLKILRPGPIALEQLEACL